MLLLRLKEGRDGVAAAVPLEAAGAGGFPNKFPPPNKLPPADGAAGVDAVPLAAESAGFGAPKRPPVGGAGAGARTQGQ